LGSTLGDFCTNSSGHPAPGDAHLFDVNSFCRRNFALPQQSWFTSGNEHLLVQKKFLILFQLRKPTIQHKFRLHKHKVTLACCLKKL
jgi:hypothetical protein